MIAPFPFNIDTPEGMEAAVAWTTSYFAMFASGGAWIVPRAMTVYEIDKTNRRVTRKEGPGDPAVERVVAKMGWTLVVPS